MLSAKDPKPSRAVTRLLVEYRLRAVEIRQKLREFREVPEDEYFYELLYCLLTPQSSAVTCAAAVEELRRRNFAGTSFNPEPILRKPKQGYVRFHRMKARYLLEAKLRFPEIQKRLRNEVNTYQLRQWLVRNVRGLGMKEASHFLRNIGRTDVVILDRHILRNMVHYGVIREIPKTLTVKKYLELEEQFNKFARSVGIPPDELDLLLWSQETGFILK